MQTGWQPSRGDIDAYATSMVMFVTSSSLQNLRLPSPPQKSPKEGLRIAVPKDRETLHRIMAKALASIPAADLATPQKWLERHQ